MIDGFLRGLRQPEYVHVLLNPLPVYGLLVSWIALIAALISKTRRTLIVTLILVFITSISAWPVYEFGEEGYDRVLAMTDDDGHAWLDEHQARGQKLIYLFYLVAALSAAAIIVPLRWPKSSVPLAIAVVLLGAVALASGCYIAYAGGKIRHREFRNEPAPPIKSQVEHEH
jgi:glucan phosphoethanolaminetransferase (alkaline phosphatase superfamily)